LTSIPKPFGVTGDPTRPGVRHTCCAASPPIVVDIGYCTVDDASAGRTVPRSIASLGQFRLRNPLGAAQLGVYLQDVFSRQILQRLPAIVCVTQCRHDRVSERLARLSQGLSIRDQLPPRLQRYSRNASTSWTCPTSPCLGTNVESASFFASVSRVSSQGAVDASMRFGNVLRQAGRRRKRPWRRESAPRSHRLCVPESFAGESLESRGTGPPAGRR